MYDVILAATDGSDPANRGVEHALSLGSRYDAVVHVISVVDTGRYGEPALSSTELVLEELEDRAHEHLADVAQRAETMDGEIVTKTCHGEPHEELVAYADEIDADLTLLGKQGLSRTGHHIGGVANGFVDGSDRPVQLARTVEHGSGPVFYPAGRFPLSWRKRTAFIRSARTNVYGY
ncbi:universal stress protein [Halorientalis pallida]|uniref:Universal stress protein n=1 Tax=Halorientalis pallida TaxID=2479928 RepID=A0A498KTK2_9EURY|nr:universal stress protein [Halorientalis pallida]RXK46610.1 universal stress protein [Halorientalis pallida]